MHIEIRKPNSRPFIIAWVYRPPDSSLDFFTSFENLIKGIDNEDMELHILGNLNGDLLKTVPDQPKKKWLIPIISVNEATRLTKTSASLLDYYKTTKPEKITISGVIHTRNSDHSLIFKGMWKGM